MNILAANTGVSTGVYAVLFARGYGVLEAPPQPLTTHVLEAQEMAAENTPQPRLIVTRSEAKSAGQKRYWTGKPCKHGHVAERTTIDGSCVACRPAVHLRNRQGAKYLARRLQERARYRAKHPGKIKAALSAWYFLNRSSVIAKVCNRRTQRRGAEGSHTPQDLERILALQKGRCACCEKRLARRAGRHADHIIPLSAGGTNWPNNIQWLCASCNLSKGAKPPSEFYRSRGFLL